MNFDRHMASLSGLFDHLVRGDDEAAAQKRAFYDEYLAVMDLPAEFYLQTVKTVFQEHALPEGKMVARWHPVEPQRITRTAILCVEGELDDICGVGQTKAALDLTTGLPSDKKAYHLQLGTGHYGVFNGGKWRREIAPRIKAFIREHDAETGSRRDRTFAVKATPGQLARKLEPVG
jgi:poly(3-hydroxybutyrate) depolymerase